MPEQPVLEARDLVKRFGGVEALRGAHFDLHSGEIVALIGDNGAGKSTLVKTLSGVHRPDEGEIRIDGQPMVFNSPHDAQGAGVCTVIQDPALPLDLDAASCLYLGREILRKGVLGWFGVLDTKAMKASANAELERLGVSLKDNSAPFRRCRAGSDKVSPPHVRHYGVARWSSSTNPPPRWA
jgi:simple sugar transport system ATP-binding protein